MTVELALDEMVPELQKIYGDLMDDLELACGKVLSVLCIDYEKFTEWKDILPFYKNIRKDGVVLWQAA